MRQEEKSKKKLAINCFLQINFDCLRESFNMVLMLSYLLQWCSSSRIHTPYCKPNIEIFILMITKLQRPATAADLCCN